MGTLRNSGKILRLASLGKRQVFFCKLGWFGQGLGKLGGLGSWEKGGQVSQQFGNWEVGEVWASWEGWASWESLREQLAASGERCGWAAASGEGLAKFGGWASWEARA